MKEPHLIEVCVFDWKKGCKPHAYTRYYNIAWKGACLHHVTASNGTLAKLAAIDEHQRGEGCKPGPVQ